MSSEGPLIEIEYCRRCRWLLRSAWMAQELLATFEEELGGVTLIPNATGGVFEIRLAGERIFSREQAGRGVRRARPPRSSR